MPHLKIDYRLHSSPGWVQLSKPARALWVSAASWAARFSLDGWIPAAALRPLEGTRKQAAEQVAVGWWEEVEGGWRVVESGLWEFSADRKTIAQHLRDRVIERDGLVCGLCGDDVEEGDMHIDHVRPVSKGGKNELGNLQVAHARCNLRKGNRA